MGRVLLRRSALGDVVLLGAVTAAGPEPVTVVTDPRWVAVARRLIGVERAVPWPDLPPGEVIDLQGSLRTRWQAPLAPRIRKRSARRRLRLWTGLGPRRPTVPELYGEALGRRPVAPPWIAVPAVARDTLALVPGAAWGPKRPRPELLVAAGRAWEGPVVVLGGPGEEALVDRVAAALPEARPLVERGFDDTIEALGRTRVALCGDTGLMHLAGACGATVVALFGPTHPDDGFFVYRGEALGRSLPCRPCALHRVPRCRAGHLGCADHPVEAVLAAVRRCAG